MAVPGGGPGLSRSEESGYVVHRVTREYGLLWWDDPRPGVYAIRVEVTDQEGSTVEVPVSLTVGTDGWVFVDPAGGSDDNDGTVDAPLATLPRLYALPPSELPVSRVYVSGVVPLDGNRPNGNVRVAAAPASEPDLAPRVWVGLPGAGATLEAYDGKFVVDAPDFYLANLELRHREDYVPNEGAPVHMITAFGNTARFTMHDVTISRFQGVPVNTGLGNSSIVMFTRGAPRANVAIVNCTQTGLNGAFTSTHSLRDSVIEKNQMRGAVLALADGSVPALYYIKGDNERVSVRANTFGRDNDWPAQLSPIGLSEARSIEILFNVIDTPYTSGRAGALRLWTNSPLSSYSWTADTPVWIYRNSLRRRISWEGGALANMPDGTVRIESNAVDPEEIPAHSRITSADNLAGDGVLDANLRLVDRSALGRVGAEIAAPL